MLWSLLLSIVVDTAISGIKAYSIYACSGESVLLFQNISKEGSQTDTFLYKDTRLIKTWLKSKAQQQEEKVSYDDYGNIWMRSITISDDATYAVMQDTHHQQNNNMKEIRLIVLAAPEKSCRPQIERIGNTLIASLKSGAACGNSGVTVFWLDYPYEALESQAKANLSPGREKGTYYACIKTPALRCTGGTKSVDFCSSLTIDESDYHIHTHAVIIAFSVMGCLLFLMIGVACWFLIQLKKKKWQPNSSNQRQDGMIAQPLMVSA